MATEAPPARSEFPDARFEPVAERKFALPAVLIGFAVALGLIRLLVARGIPSPWIMIDELVYADLALSFAESGELLVREQGLGLRSLVYPAVLAPAWLASSSMATTYFLAKVINVLLTTLVAIPVYLWARRLVSRGFAAVATVLVLLMPSFLYTGMLMTENPFFPAFVLATFAVALALERPTLGRQALMLGAIALACAVRLQGVVLLVVFPTALALKLVLDARAPGRRPVWTELRALAPSLAAVVLLPAGYVALKVLRGEPAASVLGAYEPAAQGGYPLSEVWHWTVLHFAGLGLSAGLVPVSALIVLLGLALRGGAWSQAERAFLAVTGSAVVWVVLEVAVFASEFADRIQERYLFCLVPLLLIALVLWLERGLPRPLLLTAFAALAPAALLLTLPLRTLLNQSIFSDTFALIPILRLSQLVDGVDNARVVLVATGFAVAAAWALVPRWLLTIALPAGIAVFFVLSANSVFGAIRDYARQLDLADGAGPHSWVDERIAGAEVVVLFGTSTDRSREAAILWQAEFWNRSLGTVYGVGGPDPAGLPVVPSAIDRGTGRIATEPARYVVANREVELAGRTVADRGSWRLYRVTPPIRLASTVEGLYADGWSGADAAYTRYSGEPGRIQVVLSRRAWGGPHVPGRVEIAVGPLAASSGLERVTARRTWIVRRRGQRTFTIPTPKPPYRVEVHVAPTFSPADFGLSDSRRLGVQASFRLIH